MGRQRRRPEEYKYPTERPTTIDSQGFARVVVSVGDQKWKFDGDWKSETSLGQFNVWHAYFVQHREPPSLSRTKEIYAVQREAQSLRMTEAPRPQWWQFNPRAAMVFCAWSGGIVVVLSLCLFLWVERTVARFIDARPELDGIRLTVPEQELIRAVRDKNGRPNDRLAQVRTTLELMTARQKSELHDIHVNKGPREEVRYVAYLTQSRIRTE